MKRFQVFSLVRMAAISLFVAGCAVAAAQPRIVVSIHPYFDLTQRIAGPEATVVRLLPPGASPHGFDPTPSVVAEIEGADLVVINGGIDEWVLDLVAQGTDAPSVLELLPLYVGLDEIVAAEHAEEHADEHADEHTEREGAEHAGEEEDHVHEDAHEHAHEGVNAHIWLDPVLMEQAVGSIAVRLAELDPDRADTYRQNAAVLVEELRALHGSLQLILAPARGAPFIPFHDAWPYFAARYELDLVMEIEPFPGREPGPRYLAEVVGAIRSSGAPAIFAEAQLGDRPAQVIADEAGVQVRTLDPIGGVAGRMSYEELLRYNAEILAEALGTR